MNLDLISAIVFYSAIFLFVIFNIRKLHFERILFPILYAFTYKTKLGIKFMSKIAGSYPRLWRIIGFIGIGIGFIGMFVILFLFSYLTIKVVVTGKALAQPVIPGIPIPGAPITIPFWYGIISLFIGVVVHEFSHGLMARVYNIRIKSSGLGIFGILVPLIPFAFVEPDEKVIKTKSKKEQLSIFAAGPFANLIVAAISFLLVLSLLSIVNNNFETKGIEVNEILKGPIEESDLKPPFVITNINGEKILNVEHFVNITKDLKPGDFIVLETNKGNFAFRAIENPENKSKGFIGISKLKFLSEPKKTFSEKIRFLLWIPFVLANLFVWIFNLNLALGLFNLLPLGPVDGGRMFFTAISGFVKKEKLMKIVSILAFFIILLFILNFYPYFANLFKFLFG